MNHWVGCCGAKRVTRAQRDKKFNNTFDITFNKGGNWRNLFHLNRGLSGRRTGSPELPRCLKRFGVPASAATTAKFAHNAPTYKNFVLAAPVREAVADFDKTMILPNPKINKPAADHGRDLDL
jgi:hypothetical protein